MALDTTGLKAAIKAVFEQLQGDEATKALFAGQTEQIADGLSTAIETFVKSGTVTAAAGNVRGTCAQLSPFPLVDGELVDGKIA